MTRAGNRSESGFAMLVVFLLAAFIAIGLYMELPRVVFESQRNREQALIDRGEQYRRAIQLYYRRYSRYPPDLKALENTDNRRFLRQRYKDPMTGKDEWRLVHAVGPGMFPDSLVYKAPGQKEDKDKTDETAPAASTEAPASPWMQRRPSDVTLPGTGNMPGATAGPGTDYTPDAANTPDDQSDTEPQVAGGQQPAQMPTVIPGFIPGQPGMPPGPGPGGVTQQGLPAGFMIPGQQAAQPGINTPGAPAIPGLPVVPPGVAGGQPTTGMAQVPSPMPGQMPGAAANPAVDLIRRMLTTPNPRGLQGIPTAPTAQQQPTTPMLAGVASNLEADSIKVYNDRTKYNEWEFLYDPRTDRLAMGGLMGQVPNPQMPGASGTGPGGANTPTMGPGGPGMNPSMGPGGMMPPIMSPGGMNPPIGPGGMTPMPQIPARPGRGR